MMLQKGGVKIWRPRQVYIGEDVRDYVAIEQRKPKPVTDPSQEPSNVSVAEVRYE